MPKHEIQRITFEPKIDKIIQVILYLAHCDIELTRYRLVKLIYLSDLLHLNRYKRPITYDRMVAMQNGPVPATAYNILKQDRRYNIKYDELPFDFIQRGDHHYIENPKEDVNKYLFSISDLEVLDTMVNEHGKKTFRELYEMTHEHEGFLRAWKNKMGHGSVPIRYEDMIEESTSKADLVENMRATCRHVL